MKVKDALKKVRVGEILIPISDEGFYRSKGRQVFHSLVEGRFKIAGNLYVSPENHSMSKFPEAVQIKEWNKLINDPAPYLNKTVSRIVAGNYGDIYILFKEAGDVES